MNQVSHSILFNKSIFHNVHKNQFLISWCTLLSNITNRCVKAQLVICSPRIQEVGVRSLVMTVLSPKTVSDSSTAKCSTTRVSVMGPWR